MKLITKAIEKQIPALYSTEKLGFRDKKCVVKFFTPDAQATWFVVEGEKQEDGDWLFFGLATLDGREAEWGYVTLSQLEEVRGPSRLKVERDMYYTDREWQQDLRRFGF